MYHHLWDFISVSCCRTVLLPTNGNMVIIVDHDEISQLQMAGRASCFTGNTLHGTSIAKETISMIVDQVELGLVERCSSLGLGNGKTDSIGETLTERPGSHFNPRSIVSFWMAWCDTIDGL